MLCINPEGTIAIVGNVKPQVKVLTNDQ